MTETFASSRVSEQRTGATSVRVCRDLSAVEQVRGEWGRWHIHPNSDIDFYLMVLRERREIVRPHVLVLEQGGTPQAMLVGRIEDTRLPLKAGYLTLMRPKVRLLTLPFGGLLGDASEENCLALMKEVMASLRRGEADLAVFEPVEVGGALDRFAQTQPSWPCRDHLNLGQIHRAMTLHGSVEGFYGSLSPKARKNLRWQAKKLVAEYSGDARIACYAKPAELDAMMRDVEAIAKKTYQRALGVGFAQSSEMRARFEFEAGKGWLRAYVLYLAGQPSAFWIGSVYGDTFHSNFMGYDPACAKYSPGMFLVTQVVEEFCQAEEANKLSRVDFGLGDAQYKEVLGTVDWQERSVEIFAQSSKGISLCLVRTALGTMDRAARRVLNQTRLLSTVKTFWRGKARGRLQGSAGGSSTS